MRVDTNNMTDRQVIWILADFYAVPEEVAEAMFQILDNIYSVYESTKEDGKNETT